MNRRLIYLLLLVGIGLMVIGCEGQNNQEEDNKMEEQMREEARQVAQVALFVEQMDLNSTISREFTRLIISPVRGVKFIFAHNEEEAKEILPDMSQWDFHRDDPDFPPDIIVVWPSSRTERFVNGMNWFVLQEGIDLEDFSLSYPITVKNVVDEWEKVKRFWESIDNSTQSHIMSAARREGAEAFVQDIEAFHVAGDIEVLNHAIQRGRELELGWDGSHRLLIALDCIDEYHAVLDRLETGEITLEDIMEMIEGR